MMRLTLMCTVLLAASAVANAQIYECTDSAGNKEFAQVCPPGTVQQKQKNSAGTGSSTPSGDAAAPKSLAEQEAEFRKRALEKKEAEAKAEKDQKDAQDAAANCNDARSQLKALQEGARIAKTDPNTGERSFLQDSDRPEEIAKAQKAVDSWCNKK